MPKDYAPILISSPAHLAAFSDSKRNSPWWKLLLGINQIPAGFPRVYVGGNAVPVNFFAKGQLRLFEHQLDFRARPPGFDNGQRYAHVNSDFSFEFPYSAITRVERYEASEPFIKHFNLNWVRLCVDAPAIPGDLLLSLTGSGTQMARINQTNDALYEELQAKVPG